LVGLGTNRGSGITIGYHCLLLGLGLWLVVYYWGDFWLALIALRVLVMACLLGGVLKISGMESLVAIQGLGSTPRIAAGVGGREYYVQS
jgi:hypothetical protein